MRFIYTKGFAIFFGLLVAAVALIFFHYRGWLDPLQNVILQAPRPFVYIAGKISYPVKAFFSNAYSLKSIAKENAELRAQVWQLKNRQVLFDQFAQENQELRQELDFEKNSEFQLEPCTVIGRNPTGVSDTLTINCGSHQGAEVGKVVTSRGYLVGKITYTAEGFSTVQLITNSGFSVDAKLSKTGRLAIAKGSFNSGLILEQILKNKPLNKGMLVVTAGVNDKIPKN